MAQQVLTVRKPRIQPYDFDTLKKAADQVHLDLPLFIRVFRAEEPDKFNEIFENVIKTKDKNLILKLIDGIGEKGLSDYLNAFGDVTIHSANNSFKMHKGLLRSLIPYFERHYQAQPNETDTVIRQGDEFLQVLSYVFFGGLRINSNNLVPIIKCADFYKLKELKWECERFLLNNLNLIDEHEILGIAVDYDLQMLERQLLIKLSQYCHAGLCSADIELLKRWSPYISKLELKTTCSMETYELLFTHLRDIFELHIFVEDANILKLLKNAHAKFYHIELLLPNLDSSHLQMLANLPVRSLKIKNQGNLTNDDLQFLPKNLSKLTLYSFDLSPTSITNLPKQIEEVAFINCSLGGIEIKNLLPVLTHLEVVNCKNVARQNFKTLQYLESLHWIDTSLSDEELASLPKSLRSLTLQNTNISNDGLQTLKDTSIEKLAISNLSQVTGEAFSHFPKTLRKLNIGGKIAYDLSSLPKKIKKLSLSNNYFDDNDIAAIPCNLKVLSLRQCRYLTNECLLNLPKSLKKLNLVSCAGFSHSVIQNLPLKVQYNFT